MQAHMHVSEQFGMGLNGADCSDFGRFHGSHLPGMNVSKAHYSALHSAH
jgi:hypothetical protein